MISTAGCLTIVDKNEIIIFSEKIAVSKATQGYVVAKSFTTGAKAQAKQDTRITLLAVEEHDSLASGFLSSVPQIRTFLPPVAVGFDIIAKDGSRLQVPDPSTLVSYRGSQKTSLELLDYLANEAARQYLFNEAAGEQEPGEHQVAFEFIQEFADDELEIFGKNVQKISGGGDFTAFIFNQVIEYSFDVKSRGRVIRFAPVQLPGSLGGGVINSKNVITKLRHFGVCR